MLFNVSHLSVFPGVAIAIPMDFGGGGFFSDRIPCVVRLGLPRCLLLATLCASEPCCQCQSHLPQRQHAPCGLPHAARGSGRQHSPARCAVVLPSIVVGLVLSAEALCFDSRRVFVLLFGSVGSVVGLVIFRDFHGERLF